MDSELMIRALLILLCFALPARAQMLQEIVNGTGTIPTTSYIGVVDKETNVNHFWGTAAASAAKALASAVAVDLCDSAVTCVAGANSCIGVKVLSTGQLDLVGNYCGVGASSSVTSWCTGTATCVHSGTARVMTLYDQIGSNNATAASYAAAPDFILSGFNSNPTFGCVSSRTSSMTATIASSLPAGHAFGWSFEHTAGFGNNNGYAYDNNASLNLGTNAANSVYAYYAPTAVLVTATATDASGPTDFTKGHRAIFSVPATTGAGQFYVDGNAPVASGSLASPGASGATWLICENSAIDAYMSAAWTDPTVPGNTQAEAATNLTTVPLP